MSDPARNILVARSFARVLAIDPAFARDEAGLVSGRVADGAQGLSLVLDTITALSPPLSPDMLMSVVRDIHEPSTDRPGSHLPTLVVIDASNNIGCAADCLEFVDRRLLVPIKIGPGAAHALMPETLRLAHDPAGKPIYTPCWTLSRNGLLEGLDRGLAQRRILPPSNPAEDDGLRALRQQMAAARLEVTASGRERVIAARDDLLIAVALCWWSTAQAVRLAGPRARRQHARAPAASAWT